MYLYIPLRNLPTNWSGTFLSSKPLLGTFLGPAKPSQHLIPKLSLRNLALEGGTHTEPAFQKLFTQNSSQNLLTTPELSQNPSRKNPPAHAVCNLPKTLPKKPWSFRLEAEVTIVFCLQKTSLLVGDLLIFVCASKRNIAFWKRCFFCVSTLRVVPHLYILAHPGLSFRACLQTWVDFVAVFE